MEIGTLCYLIAPDPAQAPPTVICLARKKHKIGAGMWNGYGGHCEPNEKPLDAAIRETKEESGVSLHSKDCVKEVALVTYFERPRYAIFRELTNYKPVWSVNIFLAGRWSGECMETEEMGTPQWFNLDEIPYKEMLPADRFILPLIFASNCNTFLFEADIYYGPEKKKVEWVAIRPF